jgi:hypothetical protein
MTLGGTLEPRNIDVVSAAESLNRQSPVAGRANGRTSVTARGRTGGELGRSLRLLTEFRIAPATIRRFDVDKAIRTLGTRHDGQTPLSEVTGIMDIQNTGRGTVIRFREIKAEGETFTATGEGTVFNRQLDARGKLHLVNGIVAIPIALRGPVRNARLSLGDGQPEPGPPPQAEGRADSPEAALPAGVRDER